VNIIKEIMGRFNLMDAVFSAIIIGAAGLAINTDSKQSDLKTDFYSKVDTNGDGKYSASERVAVYEQLGLDYAPIGELHHSQMKRYLDSQN
tara:strand:- start:174 stop:446 length:273 start_codon:yes stop_codon:yes gene_type:complete